MDLLGNPNLHLADPSPCTPIVLPIDAGGPGSQTVSVLHVITGEHYAGAERVQDLLAACLPNLGFGVGFACLKPRAFPELRHWKQAPIFPVPMRNRLDFRTAWQVAAIVRRQGYRLVHSHTPRSGLVGSLAAKLAGVPLVHHVHSPAPRDTTHGVRNRVNATVERWCLRAARRVIPVSQSLAHHVASVGCDTSKIRVVCNGVPVGSPAGRERPDFPWTLGTVALFRPRKGLEVLLDALAILKSAGLGVRLRAVGTFETPEYEASIEARVAQRALNDLVHWAGFSSDVPRELAAMDLFVLPSLFGEGLPMVVLEAMAAGVPVVATRVDGVPEAIRDGQEGVLANPGDAHHLANAIARIIHGRVDWATLRRSALARQAAQFSDRSMAAGVAAIYGELLD